MPIFPIWAYLVAALALYGAGAVSGYKIESWRWGASETAAVEESAKEFKAEATQGAVASGELAKQEEKVRVEIRTVTKFVDRIVEKPFYRDGNLCLDDDGVRAINAALTGAPLDLGQPDGAVPVTGASTGRPEGDGRAEAGRGGGSVPPVRGPAR